MKKIINLDTFHAILNCVMSPLQIQAVFQAFLYAMKSILNTCLKYVMKHLTCVGNIFLSRTGSGYGRSRTAWKQKSFGCGAGYGTRPSQGHRGDVPDPRSSLGMSALLGSPSVKLREQIAQVFGAWEFSPVPHTGALWNRRHNKQEKKQTGF